MVLPCHIPVFCLTPSSIPKEPASKVGAVTLKLLVESSSILGFAFNLWKGAATTRLSQELASRIPPAYYDDAAKLSARLQGERFSEMCKIQRTVELVRTAGVARKVFLHPNTFFSEVCRQFRITGRAIWLSEGSERFFRVATQVITPLGCLLGMINLIALTASINGFFAVTTALWASLVFFGSTWMVFWKLNFFISWFFGDAAWSQAKHWDVAWENHHLPESTMREKLQKYLVGFHSDQLHAAVEDYLHDLQAANLVPAAESSCAIELTPEEKKAVDALVSEIDPLQVTDLKQLREDATLKMMSQTGTSRPQHLAAEVVRQLILRYLDETICPKLRNDLVEASIQVKSPPEKGIESSLHDYFREKGEFSEDASKKIVQFWKIHRS